MTIKILILIFILFIVWRTCLRYRKKDITGRELIIWIFFWCLVAGATILPQKTDIIASWLGVGRGADLFVYISIIVLFFLTFRIIVKLEKIDRDITRIVRQKALTEAEKK